MTAPPSLDSGPAVYVFRPSLFVVTVGAMPLVVLWGAAFFLRINLPDPGAWYWWLPPAGLTVLYAALAAPLRLTVAPEELRYRSLFSSWVIRYDEITSAGFKAKSSIFRPQSMAFFYLAATDCPERKLPFVIFPLEGPARLLGRLIAHRVNIDVPDQWAAQLMADQLYTKLESLMEP